MLLLHALLISSKLMWEWWLSRNWCSFCEVWDSRQKHLCEPWQKVCTIHPASRLSHILLLLGHPPSISSISSFPCTKWMVKAFLLRHYLKSSYRCTHASTVLSLYPRYYWVIYWSTLIYVFTVTYLFIYKHNNTFKGLFVPHLFPSYTLGRYLTKHLYTHDCRMLELNFTLFLEVLMMWHTDSQSFDSNYF